ncbi:UNVERIFIED_CONTAM: hypothetical protein RMT77_001398 [Armadillidium vulgare]
MMLSSSPAPQRKVSKKANGHGVISGQNIKVFVRVRPMNEGEKIAKACSLVQCPNNKEIVIHERPVDKYTKKFSFDKVFDAKSKQIDIYKAVAKPLVDEVLDGFNCTIFAYGQTGTGKTFTMEGDHYQGVNSTSDENLSGAGIIPRCVNQLFDELRIQKNEFTMKVSFLELYNEELFDLLSAHDDLSKLRLYEDSTRKGSCIISGLEEVHVRTKSDVYSIIEKGSAKRQTAATLMNAHSSRSHTVFTVTVIIKEPTLDGDELMKTGKLHLVDLAGSENIGRSGAVDKRAREAGNINQSLLTLGRVITSLVEKAPHVPYRESKLTRLLQDALGGRTKTSIIATVSPSSNNLEETLSTLDYAHRAKNIQNRPEVNQRVNKKELICEYTNEIEKLRRDLLASREKNGVHLANENYEEMIQTMEQQALEITEKIAHIRALEEELEKQIELFTDKNEQLTHANEKLKQTQTMFLTTKEELLHTQTKLNEAAIERDEQKYLVSAHSKTEKKLHNQGKNLINCAETTISDISRLHDKLERKREIEYQNEEIGKKFKEEQEKAMSTMQSSLIKFQSNHLQNSASIIEALDGCRISSSKSIDCLIDQLSSMNFTLLNILKSTSVFFEEKNKESHKACGRLLKFVAVKTEEEEKVCTNFLSDVVHPVFSKMTDLMLLQQTLLQGLKDTIKDDMKNIGELCDRKCKDESSLLKEMQNQVAELIEYPSRIIEDMKQKSLKFEEISKNCVKNIIEQSRNVTASIEELGKTLSSQFPLLTTENENILLKSHYSAKEIFKSVKMVSDLSLQHSEQSLEMTGDASSHLLDTVSKIEIHNEEMGNDVGNLKKGIEEKTNLYQETLKNISSVVKEYENEVIEKSEINRKDLQQKLDESGKSVTNTVEANKIDLQNLRSSTESVIETVKHNISLNESELDQFLTDHNNQLKENEENMCDLFSEQFLKDISTGNTPVRREYAYPTKLAMTSPHETLINRFRNKNMITKIPLIQYNNENEENILPTNLESTTARLNNSILQETYTSLPDNNTLNQISSLSQSVNCKENGSTFAFPSLPVRQENEAVPRSLISRSASASSLVETKENICIMNTRRTASTKKRELKQPSVSTSCLDKLSATEVSNTRARKVLGPFN